jgi:AcrR family transcriptional regulator
MGAEANQHRGAAATGGGAKRTKVDGRRERSAESRRRILAAGRRLIEGGNATPTAEQIAAEAGVSLRTVFRHFEEMDRLAVEIVEALLDDVRIDMEAPVEAADDHGRLDALVQRRAIIFERLMPFAPAIAAHRARSERVEARYGKAMADWSRQLVDAGPVAVRDAPDRLAALDLVLSPEAWVRLRRGHGLSPDASERVMHLAASLLSGQRPDAN